MFRQDLTKRATNVNDSAPPQPQRKKHVAAPQHCALNKAHRPHPSPSPPIDHYGDATATPARTWASAAERRPNTPTPTPTLQKTGEKIPVALPFTTPKDNSEGSRNEGALFCSVQTSTTLTANSRASPAPKVTSPTHPMNNSVEIRRERPVVATPVCYIQPQ